MEKLLAILTYPDDLLRAGTFNPHRTTLTLRIPLLLGLIILFGFAYGAAMGTYAEGTPPRAWQMLFSGIKVPLLLLATFALSLPSFFVLNSLLGLRADFAYAVRALLATQAGLTMVLASMAPFTLLWYLSVKNYDSAVLFNTFIFGFASVTGHFFCRRIYRPLITRDRRHRILLRLWLIIYAFIGIQMGWLLRPFIGSPDVPTHFLRPDSGFPEADDA